MHCPTNKRLKTTTPTCVKAFDIQRSVECLDNNTVYIHLTASWKIRETEEPPYFDDAPMWIDVTFVKYPGETCFEQQCIKTSFSEKRSVPPRAVVKWIYNECLPQLFFIPPLTDQRRDAEQQCYVFEHNDQNDGVVLWEYIGRNIEEGEFSEHINEVYEVVD